MSEKDILQNTRSKFNDIIANFGGDDPESLRRGLRSLLERHQMDIRNAITAHMSDETIEIKNL